ncbi:hypothetical protein [Burkholderia sp. Ax-1724]|uniref:hypothetical protein n=1 Tax=Burkholderia sp. Ax-1724 TaxID=2608336 RepID=UPI001421261B|nr:hypothetical protein [Burkholderia sp. Ax-1724]NIF51433.1 hypothetical protein [Burkholderia sp. Ax-1724]
MAVALTACSFNATLMSRDSGRTYTGELVGNGMGVGTMSVTIDSATYSGPAARVGSNDTFGFASAYGFNNHGGSASSFASSYSSGDKFVKALLSSADGHGLRCDLRGQGHSGGGICVDDAGKVYDVVLVQK